jgi:hypothetical protein
MLRQLTTHYKGASLVSRGISNDLAGPNVGLNKPVPVSHAQTAPGEPAGFTIAELIEDPVERADR